MKSVQNLRTFWRTSQGIHTREWGSEWQWKRNGNGEGEGEWERKGKEKRIVEKTKGVERTIPFELRRQCFNLSKLSKIFF